LALTEKGTSPVASIANQSAKEFHFCTGTTQQGDILDIAVHPRPQPSPRTRKQGRRR